MVIAIIGESCTGKTTLAKMLQEHIGGEIYTGKDYLRLAKNESIAWTLFQKKLEESTAASPILYVISDPELLSLLPNNAIRILVTANLEQIKERFAARIHGNLPAPVAAMLEKKHGCFDASEHDIHVIASECNLDLLCSQIKNMLTAHAYI